MPKASDLPVQMRPLLSYNGVNWVHEYQNACVDKIERFLKTFLEPGDFSYDNSLRYERSPDQHRQRKITGNSENSRSYNGEILNHSVSVEKSAENYVNNEVFLKVPQQNSEQLQGRSDSDNGSYKLEIKI